MSVLITLDFAERKSNESRKDYLTRILKEVKCITSILEQDVVLSAPLTTQEIEFVQSTIHTTPDYCDPEATLHYWTRFIIPQDQGSN